ncbi:hypothetical protein ABZP36_033202 [Zizania latifolia]
MAKSRILVLFAALIVLSLLVSPIACSRKLRKPKPKPSMQRPVVRAHNNYTGSPSVTASGGWSAAGATYYGSPNGDGSDGSKSESLDKVSSMYIISVMETTRKTLNIELVVDVERRYLVTVRVATLHGSMCQAHTSTT